MLDFCPELPLDMSGNSDESRSPEAKGYNLETLVNTHSTSLHLLV